MNSMTRFDNQVFSCSFWLLCSDISTNEIYTNQWQQIILSIFGLASLIVGFVKIRRELINQKISRVFTGTISLIVLFIGLSLISVSNHSVYPIIQTFLAIFISIFLLITFLQFKNQDKNLSTKKTWKKLPNSLLVVASLLMVGFGYFVSITGAAESCVQFPVCFSTEGITSEVLIVNTHRFFTLVTAVILTSILVSAWKKYRDNQDYLVSTTIGAVIFLGQSIIGEIQVNQNLPSDLLFIHSVSSIAYILSVVYSTFASRSLEYSDKTDHKTIFNDAQRRKDFLILNKPIIVVLLLVTTYAGMVVGGKQIPSLSLTIWTLLGGALAAGGASAINQFIDR